MKFGLHHSSWLESPDPAEAYEAVKAKAQGVAWAGPDDPQRGPHRPGRARAHGLDCRQAHRRAKETAPVTPPDHPLTGGRATVSDQHEGVQ
jgi:hypothetical protein